MSSLDLPYALSAVRDKRKLWGGINRRWIIGTEVIEPASGVRHVWRLNGVWVSWCWFAVGACLGGLAAWGVGGLSAVPVWVVGKVRLVVFF